MDVDDLVQRAEVGQLQLRPRRPALGQDRVPVPEVEVEPRLVFDARAGYSVRSRGELSCVAADAPRRACRSGTRGAARRQSVQGLSQGRARCAATAGATPRGAGGSPAKGRGRRPLRGPKRAPRAELQGENPECAPSAGRTGASRRDACCRTAAAAAAALGEQRSSERSDWGTHLRAWRAASRST